MGFKDHFSGHAADYARSRPTYPPELFDTLARLAPSRSHAWDCATGNGQAAEQLARHFDRVTATDASEEQIASAVRVERITFRVARAEQSGLPDASVDLLTVAQAAHWLDPAAFHDEVRRVVRPGGVVAIWCYGLCRIDPAIDEMIDAFYHGAIADHWPPERRHVENGYRDLAFPYEPIGVPSFEMRCRWERDRYLDYLATWSAVRRYRAATGRDPMRTIASRLARAWPDPRSERTIVWPLSLRVGRTGS